MHVRTPHLLSMLVVSGALGLAPAAAASPAEVVRDCAVDGSLDGSYTDDDKRAALGQIPGDVEEYSDCRAVITNAIDTSGGGDIGARASSTDSPGTDEPAPSSQARGASVRRKQRLRAAQAKRRREARDARDTTWSRAPYEALGYDAVGKARPGVVKAADTANDLPFPLMVGLIALALLWLAIGALLFWRPSAFDGFVRRLTPSRFGG